MALLAFTGCDNNNNGNGSNDSFNIKDFELRNDTYYLNVSNDTQFIDFNAYISVSDEYMFKIANDKNGENIVVTKVCELDKGMNIFYAFIINKANEDEYRSCILNIKRNKIFTVIYSIVDEIEAISTEVEDGNLTTAPKNINKKGYNLIWDYDFTVPITNDKIIVGEWEIIQYIIEYHNLFDALNTNRKNYSIEDEFSFIDIERDGYSFDGWVLHNGDDIKKIAKGTIEDIIVYAKWTSYKDIYYNISYDCEVGGRLQGVLNQEVNEEDNGTEVTAIAEPDFKFVKWSDGNLSASRKELVVKNNISVVAIFEYTFPIALNFKAGNGSESCPFEITSVEELNLISNYPSSCFILNKDIVLPMVKEKRREVILTRYFQRQLRLQVNLMAKDIKFKI